MTRSFAITNGVEGIPPIRLCRAFVETRLAPRRRASTTLGTNGLWVFGSVPA